MTTPIEYVTVPNYPHLRAAIHPDHDPLNPLDNWDHGIQFVTLPSAGRTWSDYAEPHGNGIAIDMYPEKFAEFAGEYQDSRYDPDKGWIPYGKRNPTLRRYLDTHTAAWKLLRRDGYTGELDTYDPGDIDITEADAIAYVSRD
jgi:hypothetical protein